MRMYAACLASYNAGRLHGCWIELTDLEDVQSSISEMLRASPYPNVYVSCPSEEDELLELQQCPDCKGVGEHIEVPSAEEWAAHDWDGEGLSSFGEYPNLDKVIEYVELYEKHGAAWAAFCDNFHHDDTCTEEKFQDTFRGAYSSFLDYIYEWVDEVGLLQDMPENLKSYFDYEAYARDLAYDFWTADDPTGGIFIFLND